MATTQKQAIMAYIKQNGSITSMDAFNDLGVTRLAAQIYGLKQDGVEFVENWETTKTRYGTDTRYVRYSLKGDGDGE